MNVFHKVTLQSLKKNRTRTIVTIIGIILSAAMICGVATFASSIYVYAKESTVYVGGGWHGRDMSSSYERLDTIKQADEVKQAAFAQHLGYSRLENSENTYRQYLYVLGMGDGLEEQLPIHLTSGRMPETPGEILLPEHLYTSGGVSHFLDDTLDLALGDRMFEGVIMGQNNPMYIHDERTGESIPNEETLQVRETRQYRVVGFYSRLPYGLEDLNSPGFTAFTVADPEPTGICDVYYQVYDTKNIQQFVQKMGLEPDLNYDLLRFDGNFRSHGIGQMISSMATIVVGLIMFGSVALIYNAFSISVSERTKQFGLLSSVGATKKQMGGMIRYEALMVSLIGIPLGILSGIGGIGVTLYLVGDKFRALGFPLPLRMHVSAVSVAGAVVLSLVTVLISAWIPSRRARKVTAVEAIRQNMDIQAKPGELKTSRLTYRLFGLPGMLASKHYKRSRRKYRATVLSLFMSIVLFVSASAFTDYLTHSVADAVDWIKYEISFYVNSEDMEDGVTYEQLLEKIQGAKSVTKAAAVSSGYGEMMLSKDQLDPEFLPRLGQSSLEGDRAQLQVFVRFVDRESYQQMLAENHLDAEKYSDPKNPVAVVVDGRQMYNEQEQVFENVRFLKQGGGSCWLRTLKQIEGYRLAGDQADAEGKTFFFYENERTGELLQLPAEEAYDEKEVPIGDVIYKEPYFVSGTLELVFVYPMEALEVLEPHLITGGGRAYEYIIGSSNHTESFQDLKTMLQGERLNTAGLSDQAEMRENDRNMVTIIRVFSYGFIVLISLIAAANVFNTISTNISLRRREFAMLRSVGMSQKGFRRMMNYECLLYGTKSLLLGIPVSCFVTYLIWRAVGNGIRTAFRLPLTAMGIAALSVFAVVFATMLYAMNKIRKDNLIEALKNENV